MLDDEFELKRPSIDHLKSRMTSGGLGAVSGIMAKLNGLAGPEKESTSTSTSTSATEEKKKAEVKTEGEAKKFPDLGAVIATEEVDDYSDKVSR